MSNYSQIDPRSYIEVNGEGCKILSYVLNNVAGTYDVVAANATKKHRIVGFRAISQTGTAGLLAFQSPPLFYISAFETIPASTGLPNVLPNDPLGYYESAVNDKIQIVTNVSAYITVFYYSYTPTP